METENSESAVQTPVEPAKLEPKPKKKKKAKPAVKKAKKAKLSAFAKFHRTNPADRPGGWRKAQKKAKPAAKRHTSKNGAARKAKQTKRPVLRACRMDIRLTRAEREKITRKAAAMRRTVTSIVAELIEKMK
jgi:hypothetical protein